MTNIYWPFIQFMRFSWQVYWGGLPFSPPVGHILSELSAVTHPSWVALHSMAHRFIELWQAPSPWQGSDGTRDQITNIHWITEKAREFQKNIYLCFINYAKAFDCVDHNKLWKALKKMGISDPLTCLLRNLYAGQEATVRTPYGTTDWFTNVLTFLRTSRHTSASGLADAVPSACSVFLTPEIGICLRWSSQ